MNTAKKTPRPTVVVTGASRGIGAAVAHEPAARGHRVVVNHRTGTDRAATLVKEITASGGVAVAHPADVTDRDQARGPVARALEEFGGLDVLVCNANVGLGQRPVDTVAWGEFAGKVTAEPTASFHATQAANVVSPGLVRTEAPAALEPGRFDAIVAGVPLGRAGEPEDVARLVAHLADEGSAYLVGQAISLNGGSDLGR